VYLYLLALSLSVVPYSIVWLDLLAHVAIDSPTLNNEILRPSGYNSKHVLVTTLMQKQTSCGTFACSQCLWNRHCSHINFHINKPLLTYLTLSLRKWNLFKYCIGSSHVRWAPCHDGMARPQVAHGGDAFQLWRVDANILNRQSRTADKGWSSRLGVGRGANNSSP
jgi:hypothetical protein